jgi:hypothetical protein
MFIDEPAITNRIMQWMDFKYQVSAELYYETTYAMEQGDAWTTQYYFGNNGDGSIWYPGKPSVIGGTHDIPVESFRMKILREGMQDYEYLNLLVKLGRRRVRTDGARQGGDGRELVHERSGRARAGAARRGCRDREGPGSRVGRGGGERIGRRRRMDDAGRRADDDAGRQWALRVRRRQHPIPARQWRFGLRLQDRNIGLCGRSAPRRRWRGGRRSRRGCRSATKATRVTAIDG